MLSQQPAKIARIRCNYSLEARSTLIAIHLSSAEATLEKKLPYAEAVYTICVLKQEGWDLRFDEPP